VRVKANSEDSSCSSGCVAKTLSESCDLSVHVFTYLHKADLLNAARVPMMVLVGTRYDVNDQLLLLNGCKEPIYP
jgi:hypothetical protein